MKTSSRIEIGFIAFLLFLLLLLFLIARPVKAEEIKAEPDFPPKSYSIILTDAQVNQLMSLFDFLAIPRKDWLPLYNSLGHQIGVQNDAATKALSDYQNEEAKKNPKKQ